MANVRKKISDLTALTSASLNTTLVGVDGGTTYKIELDTLADAVTNRVNILDRNRLSALETYTASFSSSAPVGTISSSAQITTLGFISSSTPLTSLNVFTGSVVLTSSFNQYTASQSTSSLVNRLNIIESVSGSWITESETGSFLTSLSGAISSSSQLTSSFDIRYTLSGSVQPLPSDLISSSAQITAFGFVSSSATIPAGTVSGSSQITSSLVSFGFPTTSSSDILSNKTLSNPLLGSFNITSDGLSRMGQYGNNVEFFSKDGFLLNPATDRAVYIDSYDNQNKVVINSDLAGYETRGRSIVSGSSQLTSSYDTRYAPSASYLTSLNGAISSSVQVLGGSGVLSGSTSVPAGTVSGSSQLTSSYDARYLTIGGDGVISGSSQITGIVNLTNLSATSQISASVFVGGFGVAEAKYTVISSKPMTFYPNPSIEAVRFTTNGGVIIGKNGEVNDFGNKLDVSGSVRFIGNTTITGSLNVTSAATLKGAVTIGTGSGAEGGEISLAYAQTGNTSLVGSAIAFDVYGDRIRIFEGGGTNRGAYLNVVSQSAGVGSEIVTSPNVTSMQTITSASYAALTPVSGTLYIIIG